MRTVYDSKTGEAVVLDHVDARERINAGLATSEPVEVKEEESMTAAQIREKLTASGVEFKSNASKSELLSLLATISNPE